MRPAPIRRSTIRRSILLPPLLAVLAACATPGIREGEPVRFTEAPSPQAGERFPNWPHSPLTTLEEDQRLDRARHEVRNIEGAGGGVTGAEKVEILLPDLAEDIVGKGRKVPSPRIDGWNNAPRKELAADTVQSLFLDPEDYVVPTVTMRCVPLATWAEMKASAPRAQRSTRKVGKMSPREVRESSRPIPPLPSVPGTNCVLVMLAFWLQDVTLPDPLYDEERFLTDANYAWFLGNFNILTYLVDHRDNRTGNFLVAKDDRYRRVFAIDNGVTFGAKVFNWFFPWSYSWRTIKVPALPRQAVDRLRKLERQDLDQLMVVQQLEADERGILRVVAPTAVIDPDQGATVKGTTVQLGLTRGEVDDVFARIENLVEAVDSGRMPVF